MKKVLIISILIIVSFFSCKSIKTKNNIKLEIIEGKGLLNFIEIGYKKEFIDKTYPNSDDCEIIIGKYYKLNDGANYIDDRSVVLKKLDNQRCYNEKGINIFFKKDTVSKIIFYSKKHQTKKGVKVGDNIKKLYKLYGKKPRFSSFDFLFHKKKNIGLRNIGLDILYYDNLGIGFVMNKSGNKVKKIIIFEKEIK